MLETGFRIHRVKMFDHTGQTWAMADTANIVDAAIDKLCYPPSNVQEVNQPQMKECEELVRKAAALGLDDKDIVGEAANVGLSEQLARQISERMQRRHNEIRLLILFLLNI